MQEQGHNELEMRARSFKYALEGWWYVLRTQRNAWIHSIATLAVVGLAICLDLGPSDWAMLVLAMAIVWTAECVNTALEAAVDLASPEQHPLAKVAKDASAGAVLAGAVGAAVVGLLVLGPPLLSRLAD
jgi:diacylglycerol kinase (ATP)